MLNQIKLIGHENAFLNLVNLHKKKKLPNKIILNGKKGIGKFLFATHFVNYVLSYDENNNYNLDNFTINKDNNSYKLFSNNYHPNIFLVSRKNNKKEIDISTIREMMRFQNSSSLNNKIRFIIIDNVANLNLNSSNALLKSIEEPNNNLIYILTHNSESKIEDTLNSRCINLKLYLNNDNTKNIVNNYFSDNVYNLIPNDFLTYYSSPGFLISLIIYANENSLELPKLTVEYLLNTIIQNKYYIKDQFIYENIRVFIELFFYKNLNFSNESIFQLKKYFYLKFNQIQKYNLDIESYFIEFKQKLLSE
tara:strand:+ start:885 stop:1805 length:921 start_codon:yes stop_codon:yes gene_type:complete